MKDRMRWDCEKKGCYREKCCPKLSEFDSCFPKRIAMGDVDGIVEIGSQFLMLEWKGNGGSLKRGQEIMYENLTRTCPFLVYVVHGNAETMEVEGFERFWSGVKSEFVATDLDSLKVLIRHWVVYAVKMKQAGLWTT